METIPVTNLINNSTIARVRKNEDTESTGVDEEEEGEEGHDEKIGAEEEDSDENMEGAMTAKRPPPPKKAAGEKKRKAFDGPPPLLVSQTSLGFGADSLVKTMQNIEHMVGTELQNVIKASALLEKELNQYRGGELTSKKIKMESEEPVEERKTMKVLKEVIDEVLAEYKAHKEEINEWRNEL